MPNPHLELLELAAERWRQLLPEIVFVGGCATGLLIEDPAAAPVRGTYDVDIIAEIGSYAEYTVFSERLRGLGFKEDSREDAPLCRWTHGALTLDVMPLDSQVLGLSRRYGYISDKDSDTMLDECVGLRWSAEISEREQ